MTTDLLSTLWRHLWQVSLAIPLTLLILRFIPRRSAHLHYAILIAVLLKCLLPPVWASPLGAFSWIVPARSAIAEPQATQRAAPPGTGNGSISGVEARENDGGGTVAQATSSAPVEQGTGFERFAAGEFPQVRGGSFTIWAAFAWLAGFLALGGYVLGNGRQLRRFHEETQSEPSDELLEAVEEIAFLLGLRRTPRLLVTAHPIVPFAAGLFNPRVVLPKDLVETGSVEELRLVLAHELTHLRRGDILVSTLQLATQLLWWFHPLVWVLNREIRRVRELCVDADVVRRSGCDPRRYADCLLRILEMRQELCDRRGLAALSPFEVTAQRLTHLMNLPSTGFARRHGVPAAVFCLVALFLLPGAALPARESIAAAQVQSSGPSVVVETPKTMTPSGEIGEERRPLADVELVSDSSVVDPEATGEFGVITYDVTVGVGRPPELTRHETRLEYHLLPQEMMSPSSTVAHLAPNSSAREGTTGYIPGFQGTPGHNFSVPGFPAWMGPGSRPVEPRWHGRFLNRGIREIGEIDAALPGILGDVTDLVFPFLSGPLTPGGSFSHSHTGSIRGENKQTRDDGSVSIVFREVPVRFGSEIQVEETSDGALTLHRRWTVRSLSTEAESFAPRAVLQGKIVIDLESLIPTQVTYWGEMEDPGNRPNDATPLRFEARRVRK